MVLTNKQEEALKIILKRYRDREKYTTVCGYAGVGKAQPIDTMIPTPEGFKKLGELNIGDFVFDRNGEPTKILGIFPQGKKRVYKVEFKDGRSSLCAGDHLWTIYNKNNKKFTRTTLEILELGLKNSGGFKYQIPVNGAVRYAQKQFDVDPYMIGVFLGDGCCLERYLTLSSESEEIPSYIGEIIKAKPVKNSDRNYNWTFEWQDSENYKEISYICGNGANRKTMRMKPKTEDYFGKYSKEVMQYSGEKSIPSEYKFGSVEQRFKLIQGLFDTDGSISVSGNRFNIKFSSTSEKLVKDVQEVLWSLGYESTITVDKRQHKYSTKICFNLNVNVDNDEKKKFFKLSRKLDIANSAICLPKNRNYSKIAITNIEELNYDAEMVCILVDNEEHLYLTENYIVTHNTTIVKFAIEALGVNHDRVAYATFTGKAAEVLRRKGNSNAMTLHKLLYDSSPLPNGGFRRVPKTTIDYDVIVVDEISMAPKSMLEMLLKHHAYCIFMGDNFQLPQIDKSESHDFLEHPHVFLDEVMRQAAESEIIQLTMMIREGKEIPVMKGKDAIVIPKNELVTGHLLWADQILCATNAKRYAINQQVRGLLGFSGDLPQDGEKVIIKRNYWDFSSSKGNALVNGTTGYIKDPFENFRMVPQYILFDRDRKIPTIMGEFITEDNETYQTLAFDKTFFLTEQTYLDWKTAYTISKNKKFGPNFIPIQGTFGYAITVHSAQGSQWDNVLVVEEDFPFDRREHARWLYTACTRPSEKLVLVKK